jgi:hypothetical protein
MGLSPSVFLVSARKIQLAPWRRRPPPQLYDGGRFGGFSGMVGMAVDLHQRGLHLLLQARSRNLQLGLKLD